MTDNQQLNLFSFYSPWSVPDENEIGFSLLEYESLLYELGYNEPLKWANQWIALGGSSFNSNVWPASTKFDWVWGIGFPLLTDLANHLATSSYRHIIGLSGLPGTGKTSLGKWLEAASKALNCSICVISIDDFYLPSCELVKAMEGNPWNVPRGLPGSHDIKLLKETLVRWLNTGELLSPQFDKALRGGCGDRSGWRKFKPQILVIEGWFLGCHDLVSQKSSLSKNSLIPPLSTAEKSYRELVQISLREYLPIWEIFTRIWHLRPEHFHYAASWKEQQEKQMMNERGAALNGADLNAFIRMIFSAIPQESIINIPANVVVNLNEDRSINSIGIPS